MAKSIYKEKVLEYLRCLHFTEKVLYDILNDVKSLSKEEADDGDDDVSDR